MRLSKWERTVVFSRKDGKPEEKERFPIDFQEIRGQEMVRRAAEVAVAGGHNLFDGGAAREWKVYDCQTNSLLFCLRLAGEKVWKLPRFTARSWACGSRASAENRETVSGSASHGVKSGIN